MVTTNRFSEKPIVVFTSSTVLILDYISLSLSSCFGLECLDFEESSYSQLPGSRLEISACYKNSSSTAPKPYLAV